MKMYLERANDALDVSNQATELRTQVNALHTAIDALLTVLVNLERRLSVLELLQPFDDPAQAEKEVQAAPDEPISPERIDEMVRYATGKDQEAR